MNVLKELQETAKKFTILYVEDNLSLREKASKLLKKFFLKVDLAENGEVGLDLFKKQHHAIVITDIKMPKMDGLTLLKHIKKINPETKTIIMSAFDDKHLLFKGIELGIFRFLKKPVDIVELSTILLEAIIEIKHENNIKLFYTHLKTVFNYQSSMVVMLNDTKITLANNMFLDFFNCDSVDECKYNIEDIDKVFLKHNGFLYKHDNINPIETMKLNTQKLFNVKLKNKHDEIKHFILKYQAIPEKVNYGVLSFDDITELNLLKLFDEKENSNDEELENNSAIFDFLKVIQRNNAKIEIHNYYKGLNITNSAIISDITEDTITIKTTYIQQKAIQIEQKTLIVSDALPYVLDARSVKKISYENQEVVLEKPKFIKTSPIDRKTIRIVPNEHSTVSMFIEKSKFQGDLEIEDISLDAIKLKLNALPAGLDINSDVIIDMILQIDKRPTIINSKATLFKKSESKHNFYLVFMFKDLKKSTLIKYITKRQMELIREIKGIQNG